MRVSWVDGIYCCASRTVRGVDQVVIGDQLLADPARARFFAAHEAGHIALGHTTWRLRLTNVASVLLAMAIAGAVAALMVPFGPWTVAAIVTVFLVVLHIFVRIRLRPMEFAADDYAAQHGYPIAAVTEPIPWHWWHELLPTHPSWTARLNRSPTPGFS